VVKIFLMDLKKNRRTILTIIGVLLLILIATFWLAIDQMYGDDVGPVLQKKFVSQGTISGRISNYGKYKKIFFGRVDRSIKITCSNYGSGKEETYINEVNDDGNFVVTFPLAFGQPVSFRYGGSWSGPVSLFVLPNDTLHVQFNIESLAGLFYRIDGALEIEPRQNDFHKTFEKCLSYKRSKFASFFKENDSLKQNTPARFREVLLRFEAQACKESEKYAEAIMADTILRKWLVNSIRYQIYKDLLTYGSNHNDIPPHYYDFLSAVNTNENDALYTREYLEFLQQFERHIDRHKSRFGFYISYRDEVDLFIHYGKLTKREFERLNIISAAGDSVSLNKQYLSIRDSLREKYPQVMDDFFAQKGFEKTIRLYQTSARGVAFDILLTNYMNRLLDGNYFELVSRNMNAYLPLAKNERIKEQFLECYKKAERAFTNISIPAEARVYDYRSEKAEDYLSHILGQYKGKVVYIDIWATWCGPCKKMFPFSKKLYSGLPQKDIVFVYLCVDSPALSWKKVIAENGLTGEHYLVPDNVYKALQTELEFNGIPHYVLVDRRGTIIHKNARRPDDSDLKKDIGALLKD
jgi:thiol-disulfide isomerase/thioredoxin